MKHCTSFHLGDGVPLLCGCNVSSGHYNYEHGNEYGYEYGYEYGDGNNSYPYGYNYHYDYGNESFPNEYDYEYTGSNLNGPIMESVNCWRYEATSDSWAVSGR